MLYCSRVILLGGNNLFACCYYCFLALIPLIYHLALSLQKQNAYSYTLDDFVILEQLRCSCIVIFLKISVLVDLVTPGVTGWNESILISSVQSDIFINDGGKERTSRELISISLVVCHFSCWPWWKSNDLFMKCCSYTCAVANIFPLKNAQLFVFLAVHAIHIC